LADEMGVGKTPTALGIINSNRRYRKVLVFCPASLKLNWLKEAYRWLVRDFIYHICGGEPPSGATFVICNYARAHSIFTWAMQKRFDLIICDEAHKLKNPRARRTKMVLNTRNQYGPREGICSRSKKVLLLTGTPIVNRPAELFPLIHTLNPGLFPSRTEFVKRYCPGKYMLGDVENLQLLLRSVMVRRLKKDVLKDLPDKTRRLVVVQPSSAVRSAMAEEHEAFEKVFGDPDDYEVMVQALNSPPCIGGLAGLSKARVLLAEAKIPDAIEYINMVLEETDKLIVFGHHKVLLGALIAHYGEEAVHITGSTSQKRRQQAVESFMEDENIKIFLGNIQAAGVGLTLTAASRVIMLELPWDPASVTQAEDRAHRHGQKDNVLVDHFLYDGSIDGRMAELIMKKQALIEATLGDDQCID